MKVKELWDLAEDEEEKAVSLTTHKKDLRDYRDLKTCEVAGTQTTPPALPETAGTA